MLRRRENIIGRGGDRAAVREPVHVGSEWEKYWL